MRKIGRRGDCSHWTRDPELWKDARRNVATNWGSSSSSSVHPCQCPHGFRRWYVFFFFLFWVFLFLFFWFQIYPVSALNGMYGTLSSNSQLNSWTSNNGDPCGQSWRGVSCSGSAVTEMLVVVVNCSSVSVAVSSSEFFLCQPVVGIGA